MTKISLSDLVLNDDDTAVEIDAVIELGNGRQPDTSRAYPFYSGTQWTDWEAWNCAHCAKGKDDYVNTDAFPSCPIYGAIVWAYADDGSVSAEIGKRMAIPEKNLRIWRCGEFEAVHADPS